MTTQKKAPKAKPVSNIPSFEVDHIDKAPEVPAYLEKIDPVASLPAIETPDTRSLLECNRSPRVYIEEETTHEKIGFSESALFTGLHLKKQPVIAFSEDGQKIKIWDLETKYYAFYLDDKGNPVRMIEKSRELVQEFFTVLTRGHGATIFRWQNRRETWLKFNPDTPGIRLIGTFISFGAAVRAIENLSPVYRITFKSCVTFKTLLLKKVSKGYNVIDPETDEVVNYINEHYFCPAE